MESHNGDENDSYIGSGRILIKAIKKYGITNFKREILEECDPLLNLILETKYIQEYNTLIPNGYNISPTGGHGLGGKLSEETKRKLSDSHKGEKNPMFGKTASAESKMKRLVTIKNRSEEKNAIIFEKLSAISKGKKYRLGHKASEETKIKMSIKRKGRVKSNEECINISLSKLGNKNPMYGKSHTKERKELMRNFNSTLSWMNNGTINKRIIPDKIEEYKQNNWVKGRVHL